MDYSQEILNFMNCNKDEIEILSENENMTLNFACEFAKHLKSNNIVSLDGELGSGKTVIMKGIAKYFNIENEVSSPTFTIVNEYTSKSLTIYHFDVYRINSACEFINTVGTDYFDLGLCIIEWGKIIDEILPSGTICINITKIDSNKRKINIRRK